MALDLSCCPHKFIATIDSNWWVFGLPAWHIHVGSGVSVGDGFGGLWTTKEEGEMPKVGLEVWREINGRDI
ncbi:hypothetical protein Tco_1039115, partial [Tanacetum coccineum]